MPKKKQEDRLLSLTECSIRRGVSRNAIYKATERGDIPYIALGTRGMRYIKESDCDAYSPIPVEDMAERGRRKRGTGSAREGRSNGTR